MTLPFSPSVTVNWQAPLLDNPGFLPNPYLHLQSCMWLEKKTTKSHSRYMSTHLRQALRVILLYYISPKFHCPTFPVHSFRPLPLLKPSKPPRFHLLSYFTKKIIENRHTPPLPNLPLTHMLPSVYYRWLSSQLRPDLPVVHWIRVLPPAQEHCSAVIPSLFYILNVCPNYCIISDNLWTWCNWTHHKKHPWLNPPSKPRVPALLAS